MRLRLGGIEFVGDAGPATFTIERDGIRGLMLGGVDVRRESVDRPAAHGAFSLPGYLTGRVISWSGWVETENRFEQEHALARLSGLLADGGTSRLVINGADVRWIDVQRAGEPDFRMEEYGRSAKYSFEAWAPDPRMYGEVREFRAGEIAYHHGNFPATPEMIVTGPAPNGYTITGAGGQKYVVTQPLAAGQTHRIDMVTGWLYRDGVLQSGAVQQAHTWEVPPGIPGVVHTVTGSVGSFTVRVTETFV